MKDDDGCTSGCITPILIWISFIIITILVRSTFQNTNNQLFLLLFSLIIFGLFIFLYITIKSKIKEVRDLHKFKNRTCKHGVIGGETLSLCNICEEEERLIAERIEKQRKEDQRKNKIRLTAIKLRNQEITIFTKANLIKRDFLYNVTPFEFEDCVAEMYKALGYNVKQTPYTNDKGKDIILRKNGHKYLVECKRYDTNNTIGRVPLQKFFAAIIEEEAEKGFFVTTSDFKSTAIQYAKDIKKIELTNGIKLALMMREAYPEDYNSNLVKIMCKECGDIVGFTFQGNEVAKLCKNGHVVENDFDAEALSPKYLVNDKYCVRCGKPMKLIKWHGNNFWGCSDYPKCRSYQRYTPLN